MDEQEGAGEAKPAAVGAGMGRLRFGVPSSVVRLAMGESEWRDRTGPVGYVSEIKCSGWAGAGECWRWLERWVRWRLDVSRGWLLVGVQPGPIEDVLHRRVTLRAYSLMAGPETPAISDGRARCRDRDRCQLDDAAERPEAVLGDDLPECERAGGFGNGNSRGAAWAARWRGARVGRGWRRGWPGLGGWAGVECAAVSLEVTRGGAGAGRGRCSLRMSLTL